MRRSLERAGLVLLGLVMAAPLLEGGLREASLLVGPREERPPSPEGTGRPEFVRTLREEGKAGEEYHDARTGALLVAHRGNIHQHYLAAAPAAAMLRRDLETIHALTAAWGVRLVLLTYSSFPLPERPESRSFAAHDDMNREMGAASRRWDLPLVDTHDRFVELPAVGVPRGDFFASETEDHPNPRGYAEIAHLVADVFASAGR